VAAATCLLMPVLASASADFTLEELAPGVFVHRGQPLPVDAPGHDDIANIGFVAGSRCIAVLDTGGSTRIGRALLAAIRARTTLPVCYVINTHVHFDHVLGNAAFASEHAQFVGHELLPAALLRSRDLFMREHAQDLDAPAGPQQIIGPQRLVSVGQQADLDLGARHLILRAWPPAHTDCDLTVYDSASGTLWTGDLLFVKRTPALDGSLKGWLAATSALGAMQVRHVVPGHGSVGSDLTALLTPQRQYLQWLLEQVRSDIAAGRSLQEALKEPAPSLARSWLLWEATQPRNVARAYQELEWE
jgi:quinoprotein relay system zinc metallohydrolase 2